MVVAGIILLFYGRTLAPGLLPGDSGEFQTLAYEAAVAGEVPFDEYPTDFFSITTLYSTVTTHVEAMPQNAIVFVDWEVFYPFYYVGHIEQGRTDLTFIETFPPDDTGKLADSVLNYIQVHLNDRPIFFAERVFEVTTAGYTLKPIRSMSNRIYQVQPELEGNQ